MKAIAIEYCLWATAFLQYLFINLVIVLILSRNKVTKHYSSDDIKQRDLGGKIQVPHLAATKLHLDYTNVIDPDKFSSVRICDV